MTLIRTFVFMLVFVASSNVLAQNIGINEDGSNPDPSAILDVKATDKGLLIPRLTTAQMNAIVNPTTGLLIFNSNTESFWYREAIAWVELRAGNINELSDADGDTRVTVEETPDEDQIRTYTGGNEGIVLKSTSFGKPQISFPSSLALSNLNSDIFIGEEAGNSQTLNGSNILVGARSGRTITTGFLNVLLGSAAGEGLIDGEHNTMVGSNSGRNSFSFGLENSFFGSGAGLDSDGNLNLYLGRQSGQGAIGNGNIIIGRTFPGIYNNILSIGNLSTPTSQPLIYGEFDNNLVQINGVLNINSDYSLPITAGIAGQVLTNNGGGTTSWQTLTTDDPTVLSDTDGDTRIEVEQNPDDDIIRFDLEGMERLVIQKNSFGIMQIHTPFNNNSVLIGNGAGVSATGNENTLIGSFAGFDNTTGSRNTFLGSLTGTNNITGEKNTFLGARAGNTNTNESDNTFVGYWSGISAMGNSNSFLGSESGASNFGSNNAFLGFEAGRNSSNSSESVYIGMQSGFQTTGSSNTFLGYQTGFNNINGTGNIFLGFGAGQNETGSNKLFIENSDSSFPLIYGEFDNDLLRVNGTLNINSLYSLPTIAGAAGQVLTNDGTGTTSWQTPTADGDSDPNNEIQDLSLSGTTLTLSGDATTIDLSTLPDNVNDADSNPNNEIQDLSLSENILNLSNDATPVDLSPIQLLLQDTDQDTKIEVEQNPDEDRIRFNIGTGTTNGSNELRFENTSSLVPRLTFPGSNTIIGGDAGSNLISGQNVFLGRLAGNQNIYNSSGITQIDGSNTFVGYAAGANDIQGYAGVCIGAHSGHRLDGSPFNSNHLVGNVLIGYEAGNTTSTSTASRDVMIGFRAGKERSGGGENVFIGSETGALTFGGTLDATASVGTENVFIGNEIGSSSSLVNGAIAIGYRADFNDPILNGGLRIGSQANTWIKGDFNGSEKIMIVPVNQFGTGNIGCSDIDCEGIEATVDGAAGQQTIVAVLESNISNRPTLLFSEFPDNTSANGMSIEYNGSSSAAIDRLVFNGANALPLFEMGNNGRFRTLAGDIEIRGLGDRHLRIADNTGNSDRVVFRQNSSNDIYLGDCDNNDGKVFIRAAGSNRMVIQENGNTGIGTTAPTARLSVNGTANKTGGGTWAAFSDRRLKQNINPYSAGLAEVLEISPIRYQYNSLSGYDTEKEYVGVIAQELQNVAPYMVSDFELNGENYLQVDNSAMIYMLINSIKEQQAQIEELQLQINLLKN